MRQSAVGKVISLAMPYCGVMLSRPIRKGISDRSWKLLSSGTFAPAASLLLNSLLRSTAKTRIDLDNSSRFEPWRNPYSSWLEREIKGLEACKGLIRQSELLSPLESFLEIFSSIFKI